MRRFILQLAKRCFCLGKDSLVTLSLGEFDQLEGFIKMALDATVTFDAAFEPRAFP